MLFLQFQVHLNVSSFHKQGSIKTGLRIPWSFLTILFIFRPYFIYGKGKYLNQTGFFFTKFAKNLFIFNLKGVTHRIQLT